MYNLKKLNAILILGVFVASFLIAGVAEAQVNERDMQRNIICLCGTCPRSPLNECDCETANVMKAELSEMIENNMTREEIEAAFISKYGSEVIYTPSKSGFNLVAWVLPFVALAGGGGAIYMFLNKSNNKNTQPKRKSNKKNRTTDIEEDYEKKIEEELKKKL